MRFFRRRRDRGLRPLGEAEAYERVHGDRGEVKVVDLPPRRKRYELLLTGEALRRRFEQRIDARTPPDPARAAPDADPDADASAAGEVGDEPVLGEELPGLLEAEVDRGDEGVGGVEVVEGE